MANSENTPHLPKLKIGDDFGNKYLQKYCVCGGQLFTCASYGRPENSVHDQVHCTKCPVYVLNNDINRKGSWDDVFLSVREEAIDGLRDKSFHELVELILMFHSAVK